MQVPAMRSFMPLENPTAILKIMVSAATADSSRANSVEGKDNTVEATKTEPDKNTYLCSKPERPDASYNYGSHFLFQGHEGAPNGEDASRRHAHRINLDPIFATRDPDGGRDDR